MDFKISELNSETVLMSDNLHADSTEFVLDSSDFSNMQKFTLSPEFEPKHNIANKMSSQNNKKIHKTSIGNMKSSGEFTKKPSSIFKIEPPSLSKCLFSKNKSFMKNAPSKRFECYKCKKPFPSFAEVVTHLKLIHNACASQNCSKISNFKMHSTACVNRGLGCAICDEKFEDKHLLLAHFNEHINAAFYACEVCREGFQERKDLQKHFFQNHNKFLNLPEASAISKTVYQKCDHCLKYFKLFDEFEQHVSACGSSTYACHICKVTFMSLAAVEEHRITEHNSEKALKGYKALKHGKRYFCGICYLGFSKGSILKDHVVTHGTEAEYICDVCSISCSNDNDLQEHYLQHIEEHYVLHDVISQHLCSSCQKTFKTQRELRNHMMMGNCKKQSGKVASYLKSFSENSSDKENSAFSQNTLESMEDIPLDFSNIPVYVLKVGEDLLNCEDSECIIVMDLTSLFVLQKGICASESRMPDIVNSEVYEESEVVDASLLESHMLHILSPIGEENLTVLADTIDPSYLEQNEDTTSNMDTVVLDIGESDTNSVNCINLEEAAALLNCQPLSAEKQGDPENNNEKYEFLVYDSSNTSAKSYVVNNETSPSKIIARESNVNFIHEYEENSHVLGDEIVVKSEIADIGLFICNICKEVFSAKASLCLHVKETHTGNDCYNCGGSFVSDKELKDHEKVCHPTAVRCDVCDMCFTRESLLQKHKQMAHGEKCFFCSICNKSYVLKDEYDLHMMLHNGEIPPTGCEECGKIYASISSYTRHKATHEAKSPAKKFICTICDKVFAAHSPLKTHLASHMRKSPYNFECPKCKMYFPPKVLAKHIETHVNIVS